MIREFIERKAYESLLANQHKRFDQVAKGIENGLTPLQLAEQFGAGKVIQGTIILLAANYMKKTATYPQ